MCLDLEQVCVAAAAAFRILSIILSECKRRFQSDLYCYGRNIF